MEIFDRRRLAAIAAGGAAGALLRVWLAGRFVAAPGTWPWTTFAINVSGAFALGWLATRPRRLRTRLGYSDWLLGPGFCGAFTTFSTMQLELLKMIEAHRYGIACGYALGSVAAGFAAVRVATVLRRRRAGEPT
jgi:fluoride exporter